ncbi:ion channel [Methylolobus aquaticus]
MSTVPPERTENTAPDPVRPRRRLPPIPSGEAYYPYLLLALILLTLAYPIITVWPAGRMIEKAIMAAVLITGTLATYKRRSQILLTAAMLVIMVSSGIATEMRHDAAGWLLITFLSSITGFLSLVTWLLARDVFSKRNRVTANLLYGAVSVYMLIGTAFAAVHFLIEQVAPDSYHCGSPQCDGVPRIAAYVYFSFITLSTVGYGEILPNSHVAGTLSYVEAIVGQMYVAILVARLVGMQIAHSLND